MEKEFIPYEQANELLKLGFEEKCLAFYISGEKSFQLNGGITVANVGFDSWYIAAPLYQQAFRWFREKGYYSEVYPDDSQFIEKAKEWFYIIKRGTNTTNDEPYLSCEEAELECLKKLIEICQTELKRKLQE